MTDALRGLAGFLGLTLRPYGLGGFLLVLLYAVQSELRFGAKASSGNAGPSDRGSSRLLSLAAMVPVLGFVVAMKWTPAIAAMRIAPLTLLFAETLPGLPAIAWAGVAIGIAGLTIRLWAVLTLRDRYTRTLLVHDGDHPIERRGPYRFVRHPGYLGSLLCLNAIALTSGAAPVLLASLAATSAAYAYRVRAEDAMLVAALGAPYESYRREVGALLPLRWT